MEVRTVHYSGVSVMTPQRMFRICFFYHLCDAMNDAYGVRFILLVGSLGLAVNGMLMLGELLGHTGV